MLFPIAIHRDIDSIYGVTVPDIEGCFSYGETIEEAVNNTREIIFSHIELLLEEGFDFKPHTTDIEQLKSNSDFKDAVWAYVDLDISKLSTKVERFNVSWPSFVLNQIDEYIEAHHESRSGFLARAALEVVKREREMA